jgi:hypothetical protein
MLLLKPGEATDAFSLLDEKRYEIRNQDINRRISIDDGFNDAKSQ